MATTRSKMIDGKNVSFKAWGFLTMMPIKRKLVSLIGEVAPELLEVYEGFEGADDFGDFETGSVVKMIGNFFKALDEETLMWFIKTVLQNVVIDDIPMNTEEQIDDVLTGEMVTFYKIVYFVM